MARRNPSKQFWIYTGVGTAVAVAGLIIYSRSAKASDAAAAEVPAEPEAALPEMAPSTQPSSVSAATGQRAGVSYAELERRRARPLVYNKQGKFVKRVTREQALKMVAAGTHVFNATETVLRKVV